MYKNYKPDSDTTCIECRKPIGAEEYNYTKLKSYPPVFIHKKCYEKYFSKESEK